MNKHALLLLESFPSELAAAHVCDLEVFATFLLNDALHLLDESNRHVINDVGLENVDGFVFTKMGLRSGGHRSPHGGHKHCPMMGRRPAA